MHIISTRSIDAWSDKKSKIQIKTYKNGQLLNEYFAGIEYHGQSTRLHPKKSFDLELRDQFGEELKLPLFEMQAGDDFILNSMAYDGSYIRNTLLFECWQQMGYWSPDYRYVNLYIDEEFQGLYLLCEKIKVAEGRINFIQNDPFDFNFLFKLGRYWGGYNSPSITQTEGDSYLSGSIAYFKPIYPKKKKGNYFNSYFMQEKLKNISECIAECGKQNTLPEICGSDRVDLQSLIDYFLVSELTKNPDAYLANLYLILQSISQNNDMELVIGPQWDYDLAFANTKESFFKSDTGWTYMHQVENPRNNVLYWWNSLSNSTAFKSTCEQRLQDLGTLFNAPYRSIESIADSLTDLVRPYYYEDSVLWKNGTIELPSNLKPHESLSEETTLLFTFFKQRLNWVNAHLSHLPVSYNPGAILERHAAENIYPINENNLQLQVPSGYNEDGFPSFYTYEIYDYKGDLLTKGTIGDQVIDISLTTYQKGNYYLHLEEHPEELEGMFSLPALSYVITYADIYYKFSVE